MLSETQWNLVKLQSCPVRNMGSPEYGKRLILLWCCSARISFFSWVSFPQAPEYTSVLGPFRIFIRSSRCTTGVVDTGGKWKKSSIIKVLIILCGHLWEVELTYRCIFAFKFTLRSHSAAWYCSHYLPPVSTTLAKLVARLPPVSLIPVVHLDLRISPRIFEKILNGPTRILWGWGETDSWKKPEA